jgi:hypothetical protein
MTPEEAYEALADALRKANDAREKSERELAELRATVEQLVYLLIQNRVLTEGNGRHLARAAAEAGRTQKPKVRLRQYVDKYSVPDAGIDCAARLHLCHARCCAFSFELTTQDLDEGGIRWEVQQPYLILHEADGYCSHIDRPGLGCTIYGKRPASCRGFDCRGDERVWIDFEKMIPAPMPEGLNPPRK